MRPGDERLVKKVLVRMTEQAWGIAFGLVMGLGLFLATIILMSKGGERVGPHLSTLHVYLPGYSVSYLGSLIGFVYMFVIGYAIGRSVVVLYNRLVDVIER
jgi:NhaP-type Na+/H+ or K+/H+ antiporter